MSELHKKWAKASMAGYNDFTLPSTMATSHPARLGGLGEVDENDGDDLSALPLYLEISDDDSSSASSASSTGTVIPSSSCNLYARPQRVTWSDRSLEPTPWTVYFEHELFLSPPQATTPNTTTTSSSSGTITHHAYLTSPAPNGPLFVMHHGAGASGLSFALLGAEIRKRLPSAGILAPDARGHGSTCAPFDAEHAGLVDLSLVTLRADLLAVIELTRVQMRWPALPPIILVGHSLGGAVVTDLAKTGALGPALLGYAVLDVVEGSAMDALQNMRTYLSTRPPGFDTVQAGIDWHLRSRTIRNSLSARVSVPALLVSSSESKNNEDGHKGRPWCWRTDLRATQPFWEGWFAGLSKKFLEARGGKLLLLAGTDRLDTELTIGQMQGKYALQVFPEAGHFIHEDLPDKVAIALIDFHRRNDRSALVLPPKFSELLAQGKKT